MDTKTLDQWFFMRPGFATFRLEPDKHGQFLFGERDRRQRDLLLGSLEEACYSKEGHKAAVYGDFGRGKTHQCYNIIFEIGQRQLPLIPVYVKCSAYKSKEPFYTLFREFVSRHPATELNRVATEYQRRVNTGQAPPLGDAIGFEDIGTIMSKGLSAVSLDAVKTSMRWLGGEPKIAMDIIDKSVQPQLSDSREFGAVMRGIAKMFAEVDGKVPLYLIDEAERFQNVTNTDAYYSWLASLREVTEILGVSFVFFVGAKTRNDLPVLFVQDEIVRRIGVANYVEFTNPSREDLEDFLLELFQTLIRKGDVPEPHMGVMDPGALDPTVPTELLAIVENDNERLRTFPFDPGAFSEFVDQLTAGDLASKPSEVLIRLQRCASRAAKTNVRTVSSSIVRAIGSEGF